MEALENKKKREGVKQNELLKNKGKKDRGR
jgi:hypothetical protein